MTSRKIGNPAAEPPTPGFKFKIPEKIRTLKFVDGVPTDETVRLVYDNLDFLRGVEVFLNFGFLVDGEPDAASKMFREGLKIYPLAKADNARGSRLRNPTARAAAIANRNGLRQRLLEPRVRRERLTFAQADARRKSAELDVDEIERLFLQHVIDLGVELEVVGVNRGDREHAGDGREDGGQGLAVRDRFSRQGRPGLGRREELPARHPRERAREGLLVGGVVRPADALRAANLAAVSEQEQQARQAAGQPGRFRRLALRAEGAAWQGSELDRNRARQELVRTLRLYGPLETWFDGTWRPGEIERLD